MNLQPTLENELVVIRPMKNEDLEPMYLVAKDPKIWEQHPCKRNVRSEFEKFFQESLESGGALTILDRVTDKIIGSSRYKEIAGVSNAIEIGWTFLGRDYWGGSYNQAVKKLMMDYAFDYVDTILFYIDKNNFRSQKAIEKLGGRRLTEAEVKNLPPTNPDNLTYAIQKTHWPIGL